LPLALAAAISWLEALPAAGVALGLAGAAGFVALELVPVALACPFAKAGEMATVSIRQKASIHGVSLL
jgi:hypothetical protein